MLNVRHQAGDGAHHFQVYSGAVRVDTIYKTSGNPAGNKWFCGLNGVQNGPGPFNGFVQTIEDAKAEFMRCEQVLNDDPSEYLRAPRHHKPSAPRYGAAA